MTRRRALSLRVVTLPKQKAARSVGNGVAAFVATIRTGPSEGGQRDGHERGISFFKFFVSEGQPLKISHRCGFNKQMSPSEKLRENSTVCGASLQIQHNATFISVGVYESQAAFRIFDVACKRRQQPVRVATGRFDFDDVGAQVSKQTRGVGRGNIPQFDDANVTDGSGIAVLMWLTTT